MATKNQEVQNLRQGIGCLGKAADDEPLFILRAQDMLAPDLVRRWARLAAMQTPGGTGTEKTKEALDLANQMEEWAHNTGVC
jgi:hypothetical protein